MNETQSPSARDAPLPGVDDSYSAAFLVAEYERLRDVRAELHQRAFRRFEFYLTITSAAVGAFLIVSQTQANISIPQYIIDLVALCLFGYGVITFLNLTFASTFHLQIIRAFKEIQKYFTERDPEIEEYLYFSSPASPSDGYRFLRVLRRGVGGGSEKSVIAFFNSALATYLLISLLQNALAIRLPDIGILIIAVITFLVSGIVHAMYVTLMYRFVKARF